NRRPLRRNMRQARATPPCGATKQARTGQPSDKSLRRSNRDQAREVALGASVLIGIVALAIIVWFMHKYVQANPRGMAWVLQRAVGLAALIAATFLTVRGQFVTALPLALMGFGLLGWMPQLSLGNPDRGGAGRGEDPQGGADARQRTAPRAGKMTEEEAYQVLG